MSVELVLDNRRGKGAILKLSPLCSFYLPGQCAASDIW